MHTQRCLLAVVGASLVFTAGFAMAAPPAHAGLMPADLQWMPAPAMPKGVQMAVLHGDPSADGFATVRLKIPPNTTIAPHWHPTTESVTVLEGEIFVGMGDRIDKAGAKPLPAMGFASVPATHHHYAYTGREGTVIEVSFYGPFQINFVKPAHAAASH